MALPDLTGQNIQDTYQRVVQTDGTNFYNGTGSLVQIVTDAVTSSMTVATASYAISASVIGEAISLPCSFKLACLFKEA